MYCIVIRTNEGKYTRETVEELPEQHEIEYWEEFHRTFTRVSNSRGYDDGYYENAVVVNVFQIEETK